MQTLEHRMEKVDALRTVLAQNKEHLIQAALTDFAFTHRESALEVATVQDRLAVFRTWAPTSRSAAP